MTERFDEMLTGGHPNSLGRTLEVVDAVLAEPTLIEALYDCCASGDAIVSLRAFNALRRVFAANPDWFAAHSERLLTETAQIDQSVTRWTLAQLWLEHSDALTDGQMARAKDNLIATLHSETDWIALNMSMKTLERFVKTDPALTPRIEMRARELFGDKRKSVSNGARKLLNAMGVSLI